MITFLILMIGEEYVYKYKLLKTVSLFVSRHSYQLYFIHFIALDFVLKLTKGLPFWSEPLIQFLFVLTISLALSVGISKSPITHKKTASR